MNFLVDAQPRRMTRWLREAGHDATHTLDLPRGNRTTDNEINNLSLREQRTVVTKDEEFVNRFLVTREPFKLLLISTGNIKNNDLEAVFVSQIPGIALTLASRDFIELTRFGLVVHI